jgi:(2Fe-2S) ferredoxin
VCTNWKGPKSHIELKKGLKIVYKERPPSPYKLVYKRVRPNMAPSIVSKSIYRAVYHLYLHNNSNSVGREAMLLLVLLIAP